MKIGMRKLRFFILFCIVCSPGLMIPQLIVNDELSIQDVPLTTETVMKTASISMPFIKNVGQADPQVKFYANTFAGTAYLTENDLTYVIPTEDGSFVIKEAPHGGDLTPSADAPSETVVNYFKGTEENWHTDVPTYDSVSAGFVWDGVSLSLKAYGNNIEKLFTVFPGTNPNVIKMNFDGVESLSVDESGELLLHTTVGDITMTAPVAYQHIDGIKKFVPVKYSISSSSYGFVLGDYEKTLPVVIDPLLASTFLGGSDEDTSNAIAIDSSGNVYVTGSTVDHTTDLPVTSGAYDETLNGGQDIFVSKFSSDLTSLSASTYFGGSGYENGLDIAIDSSDNVYVTGQTADHTTDLPVTSGAYDESHNGGSDVFVSKFSFDNTGPTVTITSSSGDCGDTVNSTTLSYTVTFNESTSNFVVGDITVTGTANGGSPEASNFAGSGTTYTFDVVKGTSDGTVLVSVAAGVATDAAGNDNTASDSCTFTIDTVGPTVTITSSTGDSGGTISSGTVRYTITFSSSVTGFTIGDITVTGTANGGSPAASNFAGSGTTYTFDVVRGSSGGTVTVKIAADVATDSDGNDNTISNTYELTVESLAFSSICSKHTLLGNCGTISINNDVYRIAKNWNNFPATEVLVGDPVTITLSIPKKPTYTKISSASVYTEIFDSPKNYEQSSYIDYSPMNNKITYTSQSQLFQVAGATHRIIQDPDVMNLDRFEVVFTMIFAKPMDTSHIVIETKNSSGFPEIIYLTNALKVSERPIYALTLEEQSKFELTYKPEIESEPDMKREIEPEPKGICGKGTVLKDNMCVSKEWSFFDFFEQLMKLFG